MLSPSGTESAESSAACEGAEGLLRALGRLLHRRRRLSEQRLELCRRLFLRRPRRDPRPRRTARPCRSRRASGPPPSRPAPARRLRDQRVDLRVHRADALEQRRRHLRHRARRAGASSRPPPRACARRRVGRLVTSLACALLSIALDLGGRLLGGLEDALHLRPGRRGHRKVGACRWLARALQLLELRRQGPQVGVDRSRRRSRGARSGSRGVRLPGGRSATAGS